MEQALKDLLATPEGRAKLAASMSVPVRCGGCGYGKQGRYLIRGGIPYYGPVEDYHVVAHTFDLNRIHGFESPCEVYKHRVVRQQLMNKRRTK